MHLTLMRSPVHSRNVEFSKLLRQHLQKVLLLVSVFGGYAWKLSIFNYDKTGIYFFGVFIMIGKTLV